MTPQAYIIRSERARTPSRLSTDVHEHATPQEPGHGGVYRGISGLGHRGEIGGARRLDEELHNTRRWARERRVAAPAPLPRFTEPDAPNTEVVASRRSPLQLLFCLSLVPFVTRWMEKITLRLALSCCME